MTNPILANKEIADAVAAVSVSYPKPAPPKVALVAPVAAVKPARQAHKKYEARPLTQRMGSLFPAGFSVK